MISNPFDKIGDFFFGLQDYAEQYWQQAIIVVVALAGLVIYLVFFR